MTEERRAIRTAAESGGKRATTEQVASKQRAGELVIPWAELEGVEGLAIGFRQAMLDLSGGGHEGSVATGAGLGSDFITLTWDGRTAVVRGIDLLRAWVATFDPDQAKRFPKGLT
jgi:hypothetical protein